MIMVDNPARPIDALRNIESRWFHGCHRGLYCAYHAAFTLGFGLRLQGQDNMPLEGPVLVVANHQSFLDPILIGLVARRPLVYLARKTLFRNPYFGAMIRFFNAVPIDQEGIGKEGIRVILDQLALGKAVVVFPEGERTIGGKMIPLKPGIHLLIKRAQAPIVPIGIAGANHAWPPTQLLPMPAPLFLPGCAASLSVALGKPLDGRRYAEMPREQALRELFDKIQAEQIRAEKLRRR